MARIARNQLAIRSTKDGKSFVLIGRLLGKRYRIQSRNYAELEALKTEKEASLNAGAAIPMVARPTWLSVEQLRDAEAAHRRAGGKSLLELVEAGTAVHVGGEPVLLQEAMMLWVKHLGERRREKHTIRKNKGRAGQFIGAISARHVHEVTSEIIETWVHRDKTAAGYTVLTDAAVIRSFCKFWQTKGWVKISPFKVDMRDLKATVRPRRRPRIISAEQCRCLLTLALKEDLRIATYVALTCWCFLRHSEAIRTAVEDLKLAGKQPLVEVWPRKRGTPSYRHVEVPRCILAVLRAAKNAAHPGEKIARCPRRAWAKLRAAVGLVKLVKMEKNNWIKVVPVLWEENILRHTGLSYHYQRDGNISSTTRQAGNTEDTAFAHYLNLPEPGAAKRFYSAIKFTPSGNRTLGRKLSQGAGS